MSISRLTQLFQESKEENSSYKRYIWMTLGPILMMMTVVMFLSKHSLPLALLSMVTCFSLHFIWKFQLKAALYSIGVLFASFLLVYTFHESSYLLLWVFFWCLALSASLVVTALCAKEYHIEQSLLKEKEEKQFLQIETGYQATQKHLEQQLDHYEYQTSSLEKSVEHYKKDIISFNQLMIACKEEADKYFMQCEHLSEESLLLQRKIGGFEEEAFKHQLLEIKNKELLKQLNEARVEAYQQKVLAMSVVLPQSIQEETTVAAYEQEAYARELEELENERVELKKLYQQHFRDYQALSDKLQTFFTLDELSYYRTSNDAFEKTYQELREGFQENGSILQEMRMEIFKMEGAILQVKKVLKIPVEEGSSPGSYLAVADQECLRLEEENALLLRLLSQTLPLLEKRAESQIVKQPLESHSHFE